jgi:hypothetical protein
MHLCAHGPTNDCNNNKQQQSNNMCAAWGHLIHAVAGIENKTMECNSSSQTRIALFFLGSRAKKEAAVVWRERCSKCGSKEKLCMAKGNVCEPHWFFPPSGEKVNLLWIDNPKQIIY